MIKQSKILFILCLLMQAVFIQPALAVEKAVLKQTTTIAPSVQKQSAMQSYDEATMLRSDNKRLKGLVNNLNQRIAEFQNNKRFCSNGFTSSTKAGVNQDCTPNGCDYVTGLCIVHPNSTNECAGGAYAWDAGRCIRTQCPSDAGGKFVRNDRGECI